MLILGDDGGDIYILRFLRPTSSLFKKLVIDRKQVMVWQVSVIIVICIVVTFYFFVGA